MAKGDGASTAPNWLSTCRSFIDSIGDQLIVIGRDYDIMMVNSAFLESTGLSEAEVIGRHCHEITHRSKEPCWVSGCACPLATVVERGSALSVAHVHFDSAGNERHVELVGSPVRDADGKVVGIIESIRDVTMQRQLEDALTQRNAELEEARRNRDEFTSTVCHELKNILNVLSLHAQLVRSDDADERRRHADRIVDGSKRLARLVEDMRDAAAIESQRFTVERAPCDLAVVARQAAEERQLAASEHRIVVDADDGESCGEWDAWRLGQVLDNLLSNAVKFSPPQSEVRVVVRRDGARVSVSVRDHGTGIPRERLGELFHPYARVHAHVPGVGLGLFVSRGIVEAHGGQISADSAEGRGSTFNFWVPVDEQG